MTTDPGAAGVGPASARAGRPAGRATTSRPFTSPGSPSGPGSPGSPGSPGLLVGAARRLDQLALQSPSPEGQAVLRSIAADARGGGPALAGVDLLSAYPPEVLVPDRPVTGEGWAAGVAVARDVAVFVPIVITWASLLPAIWEFREAERGTSFFQLWADGFGQWAVGVVILLVLGVIAGTLVLQWKRARDERLSSRESIRRQVAAQFAVITMELATAAAAQAQALPIGRVTKMARDVTSAAASLAQTMEQAMGRMERVFDPGPEGRFGQALQDWTRSADGLNQLGRSLTVPREVLDRFSTLRAEIAAEERAAQTALRDLVGELRQSTETSREESRLHRAVAGDVQESTRLVGLAMEVFMDHTERLREYMSALQRVVAVLDSGRLPTGPSSERFMTNADDPYPYPSYPGGDEEAAARREDAAGRDGAGPAAGTEPPPPGQPGQPGQPGPGGPQGWYPGGQ